MSAAYAGRIRAFDWLRGLSVPFMIQCHALVLLSPGLPDSDAGLMLRWLDGLVAPSFLLAAGFALALLQVRAARSAREGDGSVAFRRAKTLRRIGGVLGVATLVNWMWFPIFREPRWIARVDILHCVGLSLLIVFAVVAPLASRPRALIVTSALVATAFFFVAPFGEAVTGPWAMLVNKSTGAVFPLLPWTGYVFLGAVFGTIAATARDVYALPRALALMMGVTVPLWLLTPVLRDAFPPHAFATFNPAEHAKRLTVVAVILLGLLHIEHRMPRLSRAPPIWILDVFGTSSMSAYFFHEALLFYRLNGFSFEAVWGHRAGWAAYAGLTALLVALTFGLSWLTDRLYRRVSPLLDEALRRLLASGERSAVAPGA
ncbi:MAG: DUF1624 domain-containing protein [Myxococcaceae bacterium]|nr:DUF1624 domain-containing protein [Myxococcaceae bacterium]